MIKLIDYFTKSIQSEIKSLYNNKSSRYNKWQNKIKPLKTSKP